MFGSLFPTRKNPFVPGRHQKQMLSTDFSGTQFSIAVPPTSSGFTHTDKHETHVDIYDPDAYLNVVEHAFRKGCPSRQSFLDRTPNLFAGFLAGDQIGEVSVWGSVKYFYDIPDSMSLFNPQHCEQAIRRYNYFNHGPGSLARARDQQPLNWRIVDQLGLSWVYYETLGFNVDRWKKENPGQPLPTAVTYLDCHLAVPLGVAQLLFLNFRFLGYQPVEHALKNLHALREEIFSTVSLSYSERALAEKQAAETQWRGVKYSANKPKENWKEHWFDSDTDYHIIKQGSPPPEWQP